VLDRTGAEVVTGLVDATIDPSYFERNRPPRLAKSPRLEHMREVNEFFCRLVYASRQKPGHAVARWWGESRSAGFCKGVVRPDGIGTLRRPTPPGSSSSNSTGARNGAGGCGRS
jgi:hypothetical protein